VVVDENLFEHDEERRLYKECLKAGAEMERIVGDGQLEQAMDVLASLRKPVDDFFDAVLVMSPDETVRNNRLRLLNLCLGISRRIADFSKLS
jgi:glycyl-tRNA synthetase beta chain